MQQEVVWDGPTEWEKEGDWLEMTTYRSDPRKVGKVGKEVGSKKCPFLLRFPNLPTFPTFKKIIERTR